MQQETPGQRAFREATARALALLNQGYTPEEVEELLEVPAGNVHERTALSDPTNVLMQEVVDDAPGSS